MMVIVRSENDLLLPAGLQKRYMKMSDTTDANVRTEFHAIQRTIRTILWREVFNSGVVMLFKWILLI
jgi:hypothetical protein